MNFFGAHHFGSTDINYTSAPIRDMPYTYTIKTPDPSPCLTRTRAQRAQFDDEPMDLSLIPAADVDIKDMELELKQLWDRKPRLYNRIKFPWPRMAPDIWYQGLMCLFLHRLSLDLKHPVY